MVTQLQGTAITPGYATGTALAYSPGDAMPAARHDLSVQDAENELARFREAVRAARDELARVQGYVASELGAGEAEIFAAHQAFLDDRHFIEQVEDRIRAERIDVEHAIEKTVARLAESLRRAQDAYLREREQDFRDMGRRLIRQLTRLSRASLRTLPAGTILVAHELLPSDMLELDRAHIGGLVTEQGGEASHAAILARSLGIPTVTGITDALQRIPDGADVLVDGTTGEVWIDPDAPTRTRFEAQRHRYDEASARARADESPRPATRDGVPVRIMANLGRQEEAEQVGRHHLHGVGLFRTEYLFLDRETPPSLEQQQAVYEALAQAVAPGPLVIRTLDLGGDKWPAFRTPLFQTNPNLGLRGLRFSLTTAVDLFETQVRAVVRARRGHDVRLLFPMVLGAADLGQAIAVVDRIVAEEGLPERPPVGALIETPSAVLAVGEILEQTDFLNIGTNDLTQFMLAADRNGLEVMAAYSPLHPSVLRAIRMVVDAAERQGQPLIACGEAVADPAVACLFVGLGLRRLSMGPVSAARVQQALRRHDLALLQERSRMALAAQSPEEVHRLLEDLDASG